MRTIPLLFSVFPVLFASALGPSHRHKHGRRAEAAVGQVGEAAAANAAEMVGWTDGSQAEQEPKRVGAIAGPLPPDMFPDPKRRDLLDQRTGQVKQAFLHSWNNYQKISLGQSGDEVKPKSGKVDNSRNGWGVTAIDSLSTAIMMNLADPVNDILKHIRTVDFSKSRTKQTVSLFETTIRYLGGMLSAYDLLTDDSRKGLVRNNDDLRMLLAQSTKLADALSVAFNTPSGVPYDELNAEMTGPKPGLDMANATNYLAQAGTLILEWTRLSNLTNNPKYANLAKRAQLKLNTPVGRAGAMVEPMPGLIGNEVFVSDGTFKNGGGSWGGGSDSYYEYLLKQWMYDARSYNRNSRNKWAKAVDSSRKFLRSYPFPDPPRSPYARPPFFDVQRILSKLYPGAGQFLNLFRVGHLPKYTPRPALMQAWNADKTVANASQHLACFDGGNILLGAQVMYESIHTPRSYGKWGQNDLDDIYQFGLDLVEGCHYVYSHTTTGIGPDFFSWRAQDTINLKTPFFSTPESMDRAYGLRPEVVESYYHAFRITGDPIYQDWAWDAFVAFEKFCKTEFGYASIKDVNLWLPPANDVEETKKRIRENWLDQQESYWLAETLKYLYLILVDDDEDWQVPRGYGFPTMSDVLNQKPLPSYPRWPGQQNKWVYNTEAHPLKVVGPEQ
ncbi:gb [Venturia nashicola]|uniref:alpha-1,2-Mannosidase n=1 Tax=Venturia nashicola TaxID=86259 RepID=A0A4Z1P4J6_9PEZI|nr:gb [Venturia nashicola]TLD36431.1 gb [Venturia nashicola]